MNLNFSSFWVRVFIIKILFIFIIKNYVCAGDGQEVQLQMINEVYKDGRYKEAITGYEKIVEAGFTSVPLHFNLANAYFKTNQLGPAVLHYEKALQLDPKDEDALHNLEILHEQLVDDTDQLPEFFLAAWWKKVTLFFSSLTWSALCILCLWLAVAGFLVWLFGKEKKRKRLGFGIGIGFVPLSLLLLVLAFSRADLEQNSGYAVVLKREVSLQSAPDEQSASVQPLHEGAKVRLLDQISDWYKVRLGNGEQGWLQQEDLGKI